MRREEIVRILKENVCEIEKFGVKEIGIFGSVVRGEAGEGSDIDFVVEFEEGKKNFDNFINLAFFLEDLFGKKVDLLTPESISPHIRPYVEREIVYEKL